VKRLVFNLRFFSTSSKALYVGSWTKSSSLPFYTPLKVVFVVDLKVSRHGRVIDLSSYHRYINYYISQTNCSSNKNAQWGYFNYIRTTLNFVISSICDIIIGFHYVYRQVHYWVHINNCSFMKERDKMMCMKLSMRMMYWCICPVTNWSVFCNIDFVNVKTYLLFIKDLFIFNIHLCVINEFRVKKKYYDKNILKKKLQSSYNYKIYITSWLILY
jgi:hypothetical protein